MKKAILLGILLMSSLISCSNDDDNAPAPAPVVAEPTCELKVYMVGQGHDGTGQNQYWTVTWGSSEQSMTTEFTNELNYNFYRDRVNSGNKCWIGLQ